MRTLSSEIYQRSCKVLPGGVNSPVRSFRHLKMDPLVAESGVGPYLFDVDGGRYLDYCGSWGCHILGHSHPLVVEAAIQQMKKGCSFGVTTAVEEKIASKVVSLIPSVEKIRFVSSGTEATMTALRLARGFTGKPKIIKFTGHYHGHSDGLLVKAGSGVLKINQQATSKGVNLSILADTICLPFNDFEAVRQTLKNSQEIAAIILEPVTGNMGVVLPEKGFLEMLREESLKSKTLLIFDEVITGFRVGLKGAQGKYGIDPDLSCFGKVLGGGFPVAAVGGKTEILDCLAPLGEVYQAGTLSGNPVAMSAGLKTLELLEKENFYESLGEKMERIVRPVAKALEKKNGCIQAVGSMFTIFFGVKRVRCKEDLLDLDEEKFIQFFHYLFEKGIYLSPSSHEASFVSMAHENKELDRTAELMVEFMERHL